MANKVLFIGGMHRSGTSLTAQWLSKNGFNIGEKLLSGYSDNPHGHFEDIELLNLIMNDLKNQNVDPNALILNGKKTFSFHDDTNIKKWISDRNKRDKVWGWKEPRSTLFIEHFNELIDNFFVIAVYRDPEHVIESLYKRLKRNKWYYTRNPFKKLKWYIDIDLQKNKWVKTFEETYCTYNQSLINFKKQNSENVLIINVGNIFKREKEITDWIEKSIGKKINHELSETFDPELLTRTLANFNYKISHAKKMFNELEQLELK